MKGSHDFSGGICTEKKGGIRFFPGVERVAKTTPYLVPYLKEA